MLLKFKKKSSIPQIKTNEELSQECHCLRPFFSCLSSGFKRIKSVFSSHRLSEDMNDCQKVKESPELIKTLKDKKKKNKKKITGFWISSTSGKMTSGFIRSTAKTPVAPNNTPIDSCNENHENDLTQLKTFLRHILEQQKTTDLRHRSHNVFQRKQVSENIDISEQLPKHLKRLEPIEEFFKELEFSCQTEDQLSEFKSELNKNLWITLNSEPKSRFTKHTIEFIADILRSITKRVVKQLDNSKEELTFKDILIKEQLIPFLTNERPRIRHNCCLLISKLLTDLKDMDSDVYKELKKTLLVCLRDKDVWVRSAAALALHRFQEVGDAEDLVTAGLKFHLIKDPEYRVRQSCLLSLSPSEHNINEIIGGTRDVKHIVRKTAFRIIADKFDVKNFGIENRLKILRNGLNERHPEVKKVFITELIPHWIKSYDNDLVKLLYGLDIQSDPQLIETMVYSYFDQMRRNFYYSSNSTAFHRFLDEFRRRYLANNRLLPKEELTVEKAFLWRIVANYCKDKKITVTLDEGGWHPELIQKYTEPIKCEAIDLIVPDLPHYCHYLEIFVRQLLANESDSEQIRIKFEFIFNQLLLMAELMDIRDEDVQRQLLRNCLIDLLKNNELFARIDNYISNLMKILAKNSDHKTLLNTTLKTIDFISFRTKKEGPPTNTTQRCLQIFCGCLEFGRFKSTNDVILTLICCTERLVMPSIANEEVRVRALAFRALGLISRLSHDFPEENFLLFLEAVKWDSEEAQETALKSIFDILCVHGLTHLEVFSSKEKSFVTQFTELLEKTLNSGSNSLKLIAGQGIAKLFLLGHMYCTQLLSKLLILWFDTKSTEKLRLFLSDFLPIYSTVQMKAYLNGDNPFEECFIKTVETVFDDKSLSNEYLDILIDFIIQLIPEFGHKNLAKSVANRISTRINKYGVEDILSIKYYLRVLSVVRLSEMSTQDIEDYELLITKFVEKLIPMKSNKTFNSLQTINTKINNQREVLKKNAIKY